MRPLKQSSPKATLDNFLNLGATYHSDVCIFPDDYETEDEYTEALDEARSSWRDTCEDGADAGADPDDYDTEEEYEQALEEAKDAGGGITLSLSVECPALDKPEEIKDPIFPTNAGVTPPIPLQMSSSVTAAMNMSSGKKTAASSFWKKKIRCRQPTTCRTKPDSYIPFVLTLF